MRGKFIGRAFLLLQIATAASALHLSWLTPNTGSLRGGTKVTIYGGGFSADQYDTTNLVFFGDIPCDVDWFNSGKRTDVIVCYTRSYGKAKEGESSPRLTSRIYVGPLSTTRTTTSYRRFRYDWGRTPYVEGVSPRSGPAGNVVLELRGYIKAYSQTSVRSILVGPTPCDLYKPDTAEIYRDSNNDGTPDWHGNIIECGRQGKAIGFFNVSLDVEPYGLSWNHSKSLHVGPEGQLYMVEIHPDVQNVYPNVGSAEGGTVIQIEGSGFGNKKEAVEVDVDGIPCKVIHVTDSVVTCETGRPPSQSKAIVGFNGTFDGINNGSHFEGARGATFKVWENLSGVLLQDLRGSPAYPDFPDVYHSLEEFLSPDRYGTRYGLEVEAVFTASYSAAHTFFFASDDFGELWFSNSTTASEAELIASVNGYTAVSQYNKYPTQKSKAFFLEKGQKCYLKAIAKEHGGADFAQVAVLVHDTLYKNSQTKDSIPEKQRITVEASFFHEVHAVNLSLSNPVDGKFAFKWDGKESEPVDIPSTNQKVRDAVLNLFSGICDRNEVFGDSYDLDDFESDGTWAKSGSSAPEIVTGDAFCGRRSLMMKSGSAFNELDAEGLKIEYDVFNFDTICTAFKIPAGTHATLHVDVKDIGRLFIPLTDDSALDANYVLTVWRDIQDRPLEADNEWHYSCYNLLESLQTHRPDQASGGYIVTGIGFSSPEPDYRTGPFFIDEFSIRYGESRLKQLRPAARPGGLLLEDVIVTNVTANSSVTYFLEYVPVKCFDNFTVIGVNVSSDATFNVTTDTFKATSEMITGYFQVNVFGNWSWPIPYDARAEEMLDAFNRSSVGEIKITAAMVDQNDHKGCLGRQWDISFQDLAGDQMPLEVDSSQLTGENVTIEVKEVDIGGLFFNPIPGYMLHTIEKTPQVQVSVGGIRASCKGSGEQRSKYHGTRYSHYTSCTFVYSNEAVPIVNTIRPTTGHAGTIVTINGTRFSPNLEDYEIKIGESICTVLSATETIVECQLTHYFSGLHPFVFRVLSLGTANTTGLVFNYTVDITGVSPSEGSLGGGMEVLINGTGFISSHMNSGPTMTVEIGANECQVVKSTYSLVKCIVPAGGAPGVALVSTEVQDGGRAEFPGFNYSSSLTPQLSSIEPVKGSAGGNALVAVNGTGFSTDPSEITVKIGNSVCDIVSASAESITCRTNPHTPGKENVSVFVTGKGKAVGLATYQYELHASNISHYFGSIFGGQRLRISGGGFDTENSSVQVLLGNVGCDIEFSDHSMIQCVTGSSAKTHHVDNLGKHPEYGIGYDWRPSQLVINVGDSVKWTWKGSPFTTLRSVVQVADGVSEEYNGGFKSKESVQGTFLHSFSKPGRYHYVSGGLASIGFRGTIEVKPFTSKTVNVTVLVNGIPASHTSKAVNESKSAYEDQFNPGSSPDECSSVLCYTYSSRHTPLIQKVDPSLLSLGQSAEISGASFGGGDTRGKEVNTLTIGGEPCLRSESARISPNVSDQFVILSAVDWGTSINCTVPRREPGKYRVVLHVAGLGWAFGDEDASTVEYRALITGPVSVERGSLEGGTKVTIPGVGFHPAAAEGNEVKVGNTPCEVQALKKEDNDGKGGHLVCITRPAIDDGYSAVIARNAPLIHWKFKSNDPAGVVINSARGWNKNGTYFGNVKYVPGIHALLNSEAVSFNKTFASTSVNASSDHLAIDMWVQPSQNQSGYQFLVGSVNNSQGFSVWINPCGRVEFWLGNSSDAGAVCLANDTCQSCSGVIEKLSEQRDLPAGVWSVIRGGQLTTASWNHIAVGWSRGENGSAGVQSLFVNGQLVSSKETDANFTFADRLVFVGGHSNSSSWFYGEMDEFAVYGEPLSEEIVSRHYYFGNGSRQPVLIDTKTGDYRGKGIVPEVTYPPFPDQYTDVNITWSSEVQELMHVQKSDRLQFMWTGFHDLVEVSHVAYSSCLMCSSGMVLADQASTRWGLPQSDGTVTVANLEEGKMHYFISTIAADCHSGFKLKVFVGSERIVDWTLGRSYAPISVPYGTGIHFKWDSPQSSHDVIEIVSKKALDNCDVTTQAVASGRVVARYSEPKKSDDVAVTNLKPGTHYFACSVGSGRHCQNGMKIEITVEEHISVHSGGKESSSVRSEQPNQWLIDWRIQQYEDLTVSEEDSVIFSWEAFHSLHQVTEDKYKSCDASGAPLKEWSRGTVGESVTVSGLAPGRYFFICSIAGHCSLGMKIAITVEEEGAIDEYETKRSSCMSPYCSFAYDVAATPSLFSMRPWTGLPGTLLTLNGTGLTSSTDVTIGGVLCEKVGVTLEDSYQLLNCTVPRQSAGRKSVLVNSVPNGRADASGIHFTLLGSAEEINPSEGSTAGGTVVVITGEGFCYDKTEVVVTLGVTNCQVLSSSFTEIKCITQPLQTAGDIDVGVPVNVMVKGMAAQSNLTYTFAAAKTPRIHNVTEVSARGVARGDVININGLNFGANVSVYTVRVNGGQTILEALPTAQLCTLISETDVYIQCELKERVAGMTYKLLVYAPEYGFSTGYDIHYALNVTGFPSGTFGLGGGIDVTITGLGFVGDTGAVLSDSPIETGIASVSSLTSDLLGSRTALRGIDYGVTFSVSICGRTCYIQSSSYDETVCTIPPAIDSTTVSRSQLADVSCNVTVRVSGPSGTVEAVGESSMLYSAVKTPVISSVSPKSGGTAGGTQVTVSGTGFTNTSEGVHVSIDKVPCEVKSFDDTTIVCRSGAHQGTVKSSLLIVIGGKGAGVSNLSSDGTPSSAFEYIDRWSSRFTWGGKDPPADGESVHIPEGQTVLFDESPRGVLNLIVIQGQLIFDDSKDLYLNAKYIFINGGRLQIGTEEEPFMHRAVITMHGNVRDPEIPIYGAKVIGLRKGSLDLHGQPTNITWTRLAETLQKNTSVIELQETVDWKSGDVIVIASTSKDGNETETATIQSVSPNGRTLTIHHPVNHTHYGITDVLEDGQFIDIRAEVGLLSHNVIIQGSLYEGDSLDELGADQYGSQIMIHRAGDDPTPIRLENVEVRHGGQAFRLGRYAVHFHLSDVMNGSYVRHCSIHHSNNRAITAHGVHEMVFEGNVAYNIKGHTFFIEDGIETGNQYLRNLGLVTKGSSSLLNTDQLPATFWITNPNNTFIGNAAAGSRAYGFWYDLDDHPVGPSFTRSVCPNKTPFGIFRDNVAHTNAEFGLRIWETYTPKENGCAGGNDTDAVFENLVTYSNGIHGLEFSVVGHVKIVGFKVADNRDSGIQIQEAHGSWGGPVIKDTLIISHTKANQGPAQTTGIRTPNQKLLTVSNVTFARFDTNQQNCLRACSHCKFRQGGYQYWFEKLTFLENSSDHKAGFQWEHEVLFHDLDGTLSGLKGGWVTPTNGLLPNDTCSPRPEFSMNLAVPGSACTSQTYLLRLAWNKVQPLDTYKGRDLLVANEHGSTVVPWRHYRLTHMDGYMLTLPSQNRHNFTYELPSHLDTDVTNFNAGLYNVRPQDAVIIESAYDTQPDHFKVGNNRKDIGRSLEFSDNHTSWHFDNTTMTVEYILSGIGETEPRSNLLYSFSKEPCPVSGCPVPNVGGEEEYEQTWRRWSDAKDWPDGVVPSHGQNVTIEKKWKMYVDVPDVDVHKLDILGKLKVEDKRDVTINATWILLHGPNARLYIGDEKEEFSHQATIYLKGHRKTPEIRYGRSMIVGAKAIGVFGQLYLRGAERQVYWTHLEKTAVAGSTTLHLDKAVDWAAGERLVIASSSYDPSQTEIVTVQSTNGKVVTLTKALQFDHHVERFLSVDSANAHQRWQDVKLASEVGLLSRNVRVVGAEDDQSSISVHGFGCRVLIGVLPQGRSQHYGKAYIDGVEFKNCGQGGFTSNRDPRYVVLFKDGKSEMNGSYVRHSSIHTGFNTGFGVLGTDGIELSDNVVYQSIGPTFKIRSDNSVISGNLGTMTQSIQVARPKDNHAVDFPATFEIVGSGNIVRNNTAAAYQRIGFEYPGEPCVDGAAPNSSQALFWGNTAHTGLTGLVVTGLGELCSAAGGFTSSRQWEYGVFAWTASSLAFRELAVAVGHTGLCLNIFGPDPVKHFFERKTILVDGALIVGKTDMEPCMLSLPNHCPSLCSPIIESKLGVMMSTFSKKRGKMDGTAPWHKPKSYPAIRGQVNFTDTTFANFATDSCGKLSFAIGNNKLSPDAMHPNYFRSTNLINVESSKIAFMAPPNPSWIVQEDCVDMDCDGPKHSIVHDLDGTLVSTSGGARGSIIPQAELRFNNYINRLPEAMLYDESDPTSRLTATDVVKARGIARGEQGNFQNVNGGCKFESSWNAYRCSEINHQMLIVESMDADSETRRISPIALHGGDLGTGPYTDLLNGPMDHGWCTYYTCLKRLSTFYTVVALGTEYQLWFTGSNPGHFRFHLLNTIGGRSDHPGEAVKLSIWYKNPQRKDVYKDGVYLEPENSAVRGAVMKDSDRLKFIPKMDSSHSGANYFDRKSQVLHLIVKGDKPVDIIIPPVVQVSFDLAVSLDDFFDPDTFIRNIAFVLKIPTEMIRVVDVIAEDTPLRRKRATQQTYELTLEIGDSAPKNITQEKAPNITDQINSGGSQVVDDGDDDASNQTTPSIVVLPTGFFQADDAPDADDIASGFVSDSSQYKDSLSSWTDTVKQVAAINNLANTLVQQVQSGMIVFGNATVTSLSVAPASVPAPPSPPVVPPGLGNLTTADGQSVFDQSAIPTVGPVPVVNVSSASQLTFQIPVRARIVVQPDGKSGHLIYIGVVVEDASGKAVKNLGLTDPWTCEATLIGPSGGVVLEGQTRETFTGGYAYFTTLRIGTPLETVQIQFNVQPGGYRLSTSEFSVVAPDVNTVDSTSVSFSLNGDFKSVIVDSQGGLNAFLVTLKETISTKTGIDPSRVVSLKALEGSIVCTAIILESALSDPPETLALAEAVARLEDLVESGKFSVSYNGQVIAAAKSSFTKDTDRVSGTNNIGLIAGVCAGGVVLVIVIVLFVYCLCLRQSKEERKGKGMPGMWATSVSPQEKAALRESRTSLDMEMKDLDETPYEAVNNAAGFAAEDEQRNFSPATQTSVASLAVKIPVSPGRLTPVESPFSRVENEYSSPPLKGSTSSLSVEKLKSGRVSKVSTVSVTTIHVTPKQSVTSENVVLFSGQDSKVWKY